MPCELVLDPVIGRGLVLVDAPDFDSVELSNRALAVELLEAADLVVFVTTATRYADQVPWTILERARQRGVPLLAVLNRLPAEAEDADAVAADYAAMLAAGPPHRVRRLRRARGRARRGGRARARPGRAGRRARSSRFASRWRA